VLSESACRRASGRGHDGEGLAERAAVALHHPEEQVRRARLVALEDGIGHEVEGLVLANPVRGQ
jgi:hypothetical protein